jgi:hypothetical protein
MFGRLQIPAGQRSHLCVPRKSVQKIGQLEFVRVLQPDGRVEKHFVKTGRPCPDGQVEVLSGVEAGAEIIVREPGE